MAAPLPRSQQTVRPRLQGWGQASTRGHESPPSQPGQGCHRFPTATGRFIPRFVDPSSQAKHWEPARTALGQLWSEARSAGTGKQKQPICSLHHTHLTQTLRANASFSSSHVRNQKHSSGWGTPTTQGPHLLQSLNVGFQTRDAGSQLAVLIIQLLQPATVKRCVRNSPKRAKYRRLG